LVRPKSKLKWSTIAIVAGIVLFVDQLYLFGIPFGGFLGDLSAWDITPIPAIFHHWMLGVLLIVGGLVTGARR